MAQPTGHTRVAQPTGHGAAVWLVRRFISGFVATPNAVQLARPPLALRGTAVPVHVLVRADATVATDKLNMYRYSDRGFYTKFSTRRIVLLVITETDLIGLIL